MMTGKLLIALLVASALILLIVYYRSRRTLSGICLTALQGICAFFAVNIIGSFFGVHLNLNPLSLCVSLCGGTPGVVFLLLMNTFML